MATVAQLFDLAARYHQGGNPRQAEAIYREILQSDAFLPGTHAGHGTATPATGEAQVCFAASFNLGIVLADQGQLEEAVACFRQALRIYPGHADTQNRLGNALNDLAVRYQQGGDPRRAEAIYREILHTYDVRPDTHESQGAALPATRALFGAYFNLGILLIDQGQPEEAETCLRQAWRFHFGHAEAHNKAGSTPVHLGLCQEVLGMLLKDKGQLDEAIVCFRRARDLQPENQEFHSALLCTLYYHPRYDGPAILEEHRRWERDHVQSLTLGTGSFGNEPSPERPLRIGYVSPDFRDHVVGHCILPLLTHHDHDLFEISLYANLTQSDWMTERLQKCAQNWCGIAGWPDEMVAEKIRQDGIDILVDLAVHTLGNRLMVFACKPAPVQVTFAGYPGTTGLHAIDYRLTDPYLDPPGLHDSWYAEESYRLPDTTLCFDPQTEEPAVAPLPALKKGFVRFCSLNNFCKVNDEALELWGRILGAVPGSRLLLKAKPGSHRGRTLDFMARLGIVAERVEFFSSKPRLEYLALYHQLDIGLDTFPYNGFATSLDSMWMGVPVITLVGNTAVGRTGLSQLTNLGLEELAASSPEDYVRLAVDLAGDLPRLQALRAGLRERVRQSPLMDAASYTRAIEQAYRVMWRTWCAGSPLKKVSGLIGT